MNLACIARMFISPVWPRHEQYALAVAFSFIAAVILAPLILYFYRRRVVRLMVASENAGDKLAPRDSPARGNARNGGNALPGIEALKLRAQQGSVQLAWSLRLVALVAALVTVALSLALRWQAASNGMGALAEVSVEGAIVWSLVALVWILLALGMAWPMVLLGTANPRFVRWFLLVTLPCLLLLMAMPLGNSKLEGSQLVGYIALLALVIFMCAGLVPRHMRNVVPTLTLALSLAIIAWMEGNTLVRSCSQCLGLLPFHNREEALRIGAMLVAFIAVLLTVAIFGIYLMLRALASAYRNKRFSDAQLQALLWYMAFAVPIAGTIYGSQRGPTGVPLSLVIALSTVPTAIAYAFFTRRLPAAHRPPLTLLLLRVFGQTRRGERLLDSLAASWRFIGAVCMIGGPDLAKASLEPHELAAFLTGKLKQGFVTNEASLDEALAHLDFAPDPDRRYRVNEIYCAGDIWTHAVQRLIELSDVVLIDLREFHAGRHGTASELAMLSRLGALSRTIAIIGKATDLDAVRAASATPVSSAGVDDVLRTLNIEDRIDDEAFFTQVVAALQPVRS